jgi:hypothetical protein
MSTATSAFRGINIAIYRAKRRLRPLRELTLQGTGAKKKNKPQRWE